MRNKNNMANKIYKFIHNKDEYIKTNLKNRSFINDWLEIKKNGEIILKGSNNDGYAWDGCSPKFNFLQFMFGTPDGTININTEKPYAYYASMFHDVLYQFKKDIPLSRKESDIIFKKLLKREGFIWYWLYYIGVRIGGIFYGNWKIKKSSKYVKIIKTSWIF